MISRGCSLISIEGAGSRTVLIGDAAHTIHPLAGQGLDLGLGDVECLARCIDQTLKHGGDIGSYTALRPYASERYFANHKVMSAVDKLHKLYSSTVEPIISKGMFGGPRSGEWTGFHQGCTHDGCGRRPIHGVWMGWDLLARGVEGLATGSSAARMLREGIGSSRFLG
ncbi:hypothetical protein JVU11DRAFT_9150 [Chiua virens]|nr:hypothetical protein JVU11DRAFT_9150 [Chiua virens]